jgi:hypothetical protein
VKHEEVVVDEAGFSSAKTRGTKIEIEMANNSINHSKNTSTSAMVRNAAVRNEDDELASSRI